MAWSAADVEDQRRPAMPAANEGTPLHKTGYQPESRPLRAWLAACIPRRTWTLALVLACSTVISIGLIITAAALAFDYDGIVSTFMAPPRSSHDHHDASSSSLSEASAVALDNSGLCRSSTDFPGSLCAPTDYIEYNFNHAVRGRCDEAHAQTYLKRWPQSLATRYMSDSALYRSITKNETGRAVDFRILAALAQAEQLPGGLADVHGVHLDTHCCAVHLSLTDEEHGLVEQAPADFVDSLIAREHGALDPANCGHLFLLAEAPPTAGGPLMCDLMAARRRTFAQAVRAALCSRGFATTMRLGRPPDETFAILSRARAGTSTDAELDELASNVRAHVHRAAP